MHLARALTSIEQPPCFNWLVWLAVWTPQPFQGLAFLRQSFSPRLFSPPKVQQLLRTTTPRSFSSQRCNDLLLPLFSCLPALSLHDWALSIWKLAHFLPPLLKLACLLFLLCLHLFSTFWKHASMALHGTSWGILKIQSSCQNCGHHRSTNVPWKL